MLAVPEAMSWLAETAAICFRAVPGATSCEGGGDRLGGDSGRDRFVYATVDESTPAETDRIVDFSQDEGERLKLFGIDADNAGRSDQAFTFIATVAFSGAAGELRYEARGGFTLVQGDVDGDGSADFEIKLTGTIALTAGDFVL